MRNPAWQQLEEEVPLQEVDVHCIADFSKMAVWPYDLLRHLTTAFFLKELNKVVTMKRHPLHLPQQVHKNKTFSHTPQSSFTAANPDF